MSTTDQNDQMVDIYGVACDVHLVRTFQNGWQLGAGYDLSDPSTWFVYDRQKPAVERNATWHKHCGPYSTFDQAKWWIDQIRATLKGSSKEETP